MQAMLCCTTIDKEDRERERDTHTHRTRERGREKEKERLHLIKVDVVSLQSSQTLLHGAHDVMARESTGIYIFIHWSKHLGGNDHPRPQIRMGHQPVACNGLVENKAVITEPQIVKTNLVHLYDLQVAGTRSHQTSHKVK